LRLKRRFAASTLAARAFTLPLDLAESRISAFNLEFTSHYLFTLGKVTRVTLNVEKKAESVWQKALLCHNALSRVQAWIMEDSFTAIYNSKNR